MQDALKDLQNEFGEIANNFTVRLVHVQKLIWAYLCLDQKLASGMCLQCCMPIRSITIVQARIVKTDAFCRQKCSEYSRCLEGLHRWTTDNMQACAISAQQVMA